MGKLGQTLPSPTKHKLQLKRRGSAPLVETLPSPTKHKLALKRHGSVPLVPLNKEEKDAKNSCRLHEKDAINSCRLHKDLRAVFQQFNARDTVEVKTKQGDWKRGNYRRKEIGRTFNVTFKKKRPTFTVTFVASPFGLEFEHGDWNGAVVSNPVPAVAAA